MYDNGPFFSPMIPQIEVSDCMSDIYISFVPDFLYYTDLCFTVFRLYDDF